MIRNVSYMHIHIYDTFWRFDMICQRCVKTLWWAACFIFSKSTTLRRSYTSRNSQLWSNEYSRNNRLRKQFFPFTQTITIISKWGVLFSQNSKNLTDWMYQNICKNLQSKESFKNFKVQKRTLFPCINNTLPFSQY